MFIIKKILDRILIPFAAYSLFFLFIGQACFAAPGIKIVEPQNGAVLHPGEEFTLRIESVDGFVIEKGIMGMFKVMGIYEFKTLPLVLTPKVPIEAIGAMTISVSAGDASDNWSDDEITIIVEPTATLQSLKIDQDDVWVDLDWNGNIRKDATSTTCGIVTVYGKYSDGVERQLTNVSGLTYTSSDPSVVSVNNKGDCEVYKVGEASITVSCLGVSKAMPLVFHKPTGLRPRETIPPVTQINIQPQPNSAGWNNSDMTITLTAQDNEGGSGILEIDYSILGTDQQGLHVENDKADIAFSEEGIHKLVYWARDKEGNVEKADNSFELYLDKTPPKLSITATPDTLWPPDNKMVDVTISGKAEDSLSGIDSLSFKVTDEYGKVQPIITGFGSTIKLEASRDGNDKDGRIYAISVTAKDKAGNESTASTIVTVPHDQGQGKK